MKGKIWILGLVCSFLFSCGMPMAKQIKAYPKPADETYNQLILVLQEIGWTIKHTDKISFIILAEILPESETMGALFSGTQARPYQGSFSIREETGKSSVSITITQPGEIIKSNTPKKLTDEILKKLEEKIR